jgi:hypothetical protein
MLRADPPDRSIFPRGDANAGRNFTITVIDEIVTPAKTGKPTPPPP